MDAQELAAVVQFHGHFCPGLAIGVRAAELALQEVGFHPGGEGLVAIVETDMCMVDAIQYMTGCTYGKGNLIHLDYGKNAFTFIQRAEGKAIRLILRPQALEKLNEEQRELTARIQHGKASPEDHERSKDLFKQRGLAILDLPLEQLFDVQIVELHIPANARVRESIQCEACGEMVMETRVRLMGGRKLCIPCFEADAQHM